ncbi:DUF413 domain-containing protein [Halovulum sp. GXIMD14794]
MKRLPVSDLTPWDRSLLARYLDFYEDLASGRRTPSNAAQARFVEVAAGRAQPRSQHELAYSRYMEHCRKEALPSGLPAPAEIVEAIDEIEGAELHPGLSHRVGLGIGKLQSGLRNRAARFKDQGSQAAMWVAAITADSEWARQVERWSAEQFNTLSNAYTQAMDAEFLQNAVGTPITHRILDGGHSLAGSWDAARQALADDSFWAELRGWAGAYASDLASVVGMPVTTLSSESLAWLEETVAVLGINQAELVDALSLNAVELAATAIPALAALLNWSEPERQAFARFIGSSGIAALASANPLLFLVSLVCAARAFHQQRKKPQGLRQLAADVASGGALSGVVLATSAVVAGPVWVGMVAGILAAMLLQKAGKSIDAAALMAAIGRMISRAPRRAGGIQPASA